jgi:hypothetical protein
MRATKCKRRRHAWLLCINVQPLVDTIDRTLLLGVCTRGRSRGGLSRLAALTLGGSNGTGVL